MSASIGISSDGSLESDLISVAIDGGIYCSRCRPDDPEGRLAASTAEHTLAYLLPCPELDRLRVHYPAFADHFERSSAERLRRALDAINTVQASLGIRYQAGRFV